MGSDETRDRATDPKVKFLVLALCAVLLLVLVVLIGLIARSSIERGIDATSALMSDKPERTKPMLSNPRFVKPIGNPGAWFANDDYPPEARRNGEEGRVSISLLVDRDGRVSGCMVKESSGHPALDEATCRVATRNGRFRPATDAAGRPIASTYVLPGVRWQLESDTPRLF